MSTGLLWGRGGGQVVKWGTTFGALKVVGLFTCKG